MTITSRSIVEGIQAGARPNSLKDADFVQSLARGLVVIRSFDDEHRRQTLSEVAGRTGLTRATARRLLLTLKDLGYVHMDGREFSLSPAVLRLGYAYLSSLGAPAIAQPYLEALSENVRESSSMTVLDGTEVVYVARVPTKRIFSVALGIGSRLPAFATSMGRVLLAGMSEEEIRHTIEQSNVEQFTEHTITDPDRLVEEIGRAGVQGWYMLDEELELGLRSVAAPVHDASGKLVAAINVSTPKARVSSEQLEHEIVPRLVETARLISGALQSR